MSEEKDREGADPILASSLARAWDLFVPEDRAEARRIFSSLPVKDQLEVVLRARGKERLRRLFLSENPEKLVPRLPDLEVFLTVKEVGKADAVDLLSLTTSEQFQFLLDLDFWEKDRINPEKVLYWMEILLEAGEDKAAAFIRSSEPGEIALLLKEFLIVRTVEGEHTEDLDGGPFVTLDQYYFVQFQKAKGAREVFEPFLRILFQTDPHTYRRLMESLMGELESDLEETSYRLRNGRLSEHGFPEFEESLEIYRFVNPEAPVLPEKPPPSERPDEEEMTSPVFYLTFREEGPFLASLVSRIEDPREEDRLRQELAALCNRAMVAESIDLFEISEMERVTKKAYRYLNIGLQYVSRGDPARAFEILRSAPLQRLFQWGVSATVLLKKKAESILKGPWFGGKRENLLLLDPPYLERFEGLLQRRPALQRGGMMGDFKDIQDLDETRVLLERIDALASLFGEKLGLDPETLRELNLTGCHPGAWQEIRLSTILLTVIGNRVLTGAYQFKAIPRNSLRNLLSRIFDRHDTDRRSIAMEIRKDLKEWVDEFEGDESRRQHLLAFQDFCLDLLAEDYGRIPSKEEIDPRFTRGLLVCE